VKLISHPSPDRGITRLEVVVLLALAAVLALVFLPLTTSTRRSLDPALVHRVHCQSNLGHVGRMIDVFAKDHGGRFPSHVPASQGGSMESALSGGVHASFLPLADETPSWKVLWCPADIARAPVGQSVQLWESNISYFISVDASPSSPGAIVSGDRNLEVGSMAARSGLVTLTTDISVGWTREIHTLKGRPCGNLLFADSHVETVQGALTEAIRLQGLSSNRIVIP
jgi:prepilin-type processing-associated H-X9-DG protein